MQIRPNSISHLGEKSEAWLLQLWERASSVESAGHVAVIRRCRTTGTVRHRRMHHIFFSHRRWGWHISARIGRRRPKWMSHACRPYEDELVVLRSYISDGSLMHAWPSARPSIKTSFDSDELAYSSVDEYGMKQGRRRIAPGGPPAGCSCAFHRPRGRNRQDQGRTNGIHWLSWVGQ